MHPTGAKEVPLRVPPQQEQKVYFNTFCCPESIKLPSDLNAGMALGRVSECP